MVSNDAGAVAEYTSTDLQWGAGAGTPNGNFLSRTQGVSAYNAFQIISLAPELGLDQSKSVGASASDRPTSL